MDRDKELAYNKKISEKILQVLEYADLEIKGIAVLTNKSIDIFYAVISGRRTLSKDLARTIGDALNFNGNELFNLNSPVPKTIKNSPNLQQFKKDNVNNINYFSSSWTAKKDSTFIKENLIDNNFFATPRYTWEVNVELKRLNKEIKNDHLSSYLQYFTETGILKKESRTIKLRDGSQGKRSAFVYYSAEEKSTS